MNLADTWLYHVGFYLPKGVQTRGEYICEFLLKVLDYTSPSDLQTFSKVILLLLVLCAILTMTILIVLPVSDLAPRRP